MPLDGHGKRFSPTAPSPRHRRGPASPSQGSVGPSRTPHARQQPRRTTAMPRKPKKPTTAPPTESVVSEARRKSAALLNLNPGDLSPAGALKCDMVSALRLVIDDELARATSGSGADLGKLITAVEHLAGILKEAHPTRSDDGIPAIYKKDPYVVMEGILDRWLATDEEERSERGLSPRIHDEAALQRRVDDLEAELVRLRGAQPHALPSPAPEADETDAIDVPTSAITPPGEQTDSDRNLYRGGPRPPPGYD